MTRGRPQRHAATGGRAVGVHAVSRDATGDCNELCDRQRSHDTSRIAWAKLMAGMGDEFPVVCLGCGGDIPLMAFIPDPGAILKTLTNFCEPLEPSPVYPAQGPPADWAELVQVHNDRSVFQAPSDELPVIDTHSL